MTEPNLYRCTPRQVRTYVEEVFEAGLVPNIISSPGMGKSSILRGVAEAFNLELLDNRLSTMSPVDLNGFPTMKIINGVEYASFAPFENFPVDTTELPKGKEGWLVFYDEFNSGAKTVQAAAYKVILDRMIGLRKLHERVVQACAGNLMTDRAITNNLSTAMQSRLITIEMMLSHREWLEDVAYPEDYDEKIIGFLNFEEKYLMDFRPDHQDKTFACPRTWEFMNKLIKGKSIEHIKSRTSLYAGTITSGVAAAFVQYCGVYTNLITIQAVLADPDNAAVPSDMESKWAIVSSLSGKVTDDNFAEICTYIDRFDLTFRIMFYRSAQTRQPKLRSHPAFAKAMSTLIRYLKPDS